MIHPTKLWNPRWVQRPEKACLYLDVVRYSVAHAWPSFVKALPDAVPWCPSGTSMVLRHSVIWECCFKWSIKFWFISDFNHKIRWRPIILHKSICCITWIKLLQPTFVQICGKLMKFVLMDCVVLCLALRILQVTFSSALRKMIVSIYFFMHRWGMPALPTYLPFPINTRC